MCSEARKEREYIDDNRAQDGLQRGQKGRKVGGWIVES